MRTAREVLCPQCGGRSAIDPEYASLPAWACPFCAAVNPMPPGETAVLLAKPTSDLVPKPRDRSNAIPIAAAGLLGAIVIASIALQATNPRPPLRTIAGIVEELSRAGLPCQDVRPDAAFPPARESGSCTLGNRPINILTFAGPSQRDRTIGKLPAGYHAAGETWIVGAPDARMALAIARALKGHMLEKE